MAPQLTPTTPSGSALGSGTVARRDRLGPRLLGAMLLDRETFRTVAGDRRALVEAALVVAVGGIAQDLGTTGLWPLGESSYHLARTAPAAASAFVGWIVPTIAIWLVAAGRREDRSTLFRRLLCAVGFSSAPQILYLLCLPALGPLDAPTAAWAIAAAAWLLTQGALFVAVQESLGATTIRTLIVFAIAGAITVALGIAAALFLPAVVWKPLLL
jgi:hypothetical protein